LATSRSRRPVRYANQLLAQIESLIVTVKREKPYWGARKIRELLVRHLAGYLRVPAKVRTLMLYRRPRSLTDAERVLLKRRTGLTNSR